MSHTAMAANYFPDLRRLLEEGVLFSFAGFLSEGVLQALGDTLRKKMALERADVNQSRRVFSVFVELAQNIIRYSAERLDREGSGAKDRLGCGIVAVGREDHRFFVVCGNMVRRAEVDGLKERLSYLATLDREGLRAHFRERLRGSGGDEDEVTEGASVGLIEIARCVSGPIRFDFLDVDADRAFFCLKAYI
jgi:hypothetical protein